jgi:hypothetical protein
MDFNNFSNQDGGGWPSPKPSLTEPGVKFFLHQTLKQCHVVRENFHNMVFNIGLFIAFLLVLGLILMYKFKGKMTPAEIEQKNREKQQYILSKIQKFQQAKRVARQELITGLPAWESEYDIIHSKHIY